MLMYNLTRVWMLRTPNAGLNLYFQHFLWQKAEKMQKSKKFTSKFSKKTGVLKFASNRWSKYSTGTEPLKNEIHQQSIFSLIFASVSAKFYKITF